MYTDTLEQIELLLELKIENKMEGWCKKWSHCGQDINKDREVEGAAL